MSIKNSATRLAAYAAGAAVTIALAGAVVALPAQAAGLTSSQVQSILSLLASFGADQGTINNVQAALNGQATTGTTGGTTTMSGGACPYTWSTNLTVGSDNADVMALQKFLNMSATTEVAASGTGSPGMESMYFGQLTKAAVVKFQVANGISPTSGYVGPLTRAKLNSLCSNGTTTTTGGGTTTTGSTGTAVITSGAQPANSVIPVNAARVPFTAFTVMAQGGDVTLNSVSVQRQGIANDTDFAGVALVQASTGIQLGISRVLDANHSATIGAPITIPSGSSMTFWVVGNANTSVGSGDIASFAITAINTSGTVSGSLPITGASNTFNNNIAIGQTTATVSSYDPNSAGSQPIGTTAYRFSGIHLATNSTEDQTLKSITWYDSGSATGLNNVMTVVNGTSYPTVVDSTGRYYTSTFPGGIVIPKGGSADVYVQGDLTGNIVANTSAEFDIYRPTDIYMVGNEYGYGVTVTATTQGSYTSTGTHGSGFQATSNPFFFGSTLAVTAGTISTIQSATSIASQNIAINVPNQPLGGFVTNLTGEAITAQQVVIHLIVPSGSATSTIPLLTNVSLVGPNGAIIAGPFNAVRDVTTPGTTYTSSTGVVTYSNQQVTFTGSVNLPVGSQTYTIEGEVPTTATNGATIQAMTNPFTDWSSVTGNTTGTNITLPNSSITMSTMTIKAGQLSVSNSSSITNQTVIGGSNNFVFGQVQLDASQSGENVRLSSIPMTVILAGSAPNTNDLSACQLYNGTTALNTGSRVVNSSNILSGATGGATGGTGTYNVTFSFDNSLTVPKGTILDLNLECNLSSGAQSGATYNWSVSTSGYAATGVTSGSTIGVTGAGGAVLSGNVGTAPTMTASTGGTMVTTVYSSSPSYALAAGGTTGVTLGVLNLHSTNEVMNLTKLGVNLAQGHAADLSNVYFYGPTGTLLGTAQFTGGTAYATSTFSTPLALAANTDTQITVKGDIATIGVNQPATEGDLVQVNPSSAEGIGQSSGKTVDVGASGSTSGVRIFRTFPIVAVGPAVSSNPNGTNQVLGRFTISANSANQLGLDQVAIAIATSSATVSNLQLHAYTDQACSQPATVPGSTSGQFGTTDGFTTSQGVTAYADGALPANGTAIYFHQVVAPYEIGSNTTTCFSLTGNVSPVFNANNWTVGVTLNGDSTTVGVTNVTALNSYGFIWSPNASSTAATTTALAGSGDWTNGAGVQGLPSTGLGF